MGTACAHCYWMLDVPMPGSAQNHTHTHTHPCIYFYVYLSVLKTLISPIPIKQQCSCWFSPFPLGWAVRNLPPIILSTYLVSLQAIPSLLSPPLPCPPPSAHTLPTPQERACSPYTSWSDPCARSAPCGDLLTLCSAPFHPSPSRQTLILLGSTWCSLNVTVQKGKTRG